MLFSFSLSLHNAIGYIMARLSMTLVILLGRTVPSFRIALEMEKQEWKPFRNALDKSQRRSFDEMWDIPKLYISACSNSSACTATSNIDIYPLPSLQGA